MLKRQEEIITKWYKHFLNNEENLQLLLSSYSEIDEDMPIKQLIENGDTLYNLAYLLLKVESAYCEYVKKGISIKIFNDTFSDIQKWVDNYYIESGKFGFKEIVWLSNHIKLNVFKLGRLQFKFGYSKIDYEPLSVKIGDMVIEVHIPQGEKLDYEKCKQSYEMAREFFTKYYSDYNIKVFTCMSWLLDESICKMVGEKSNIYKFAKDYDIVFSVERNSAIRYVFGDAYVDKDVNEYPTNSSLQKNMVEFLKNGGILKAGYGIKKF